MTRRALFALAIVVLAAGIAFAVLLPSASSHFRLGPYLPGTPNVVQEGDHRIPLRVGVAVGGLIVGGSMLLLSRRVHQ